MRWGGFVAFALLLALSACAAIDYRGAAPGRFSGSVFVMWVDEGNQSGDGTFLFVPDPQAPLTFTRADAKRPGAVIRPGIMYTDGGSIPKIAQVFKGLSPWGYAPAYMIHDWLFIARHCLVDGQELERFGTLKTVDFNQSAQILAEAIQALVKARQVHKNDVAGEAITLAVDSGIARNRWDETGACAGTSVKPEHLAAAARAFPGPQNAIAKRIAGGRALAAIPPAGGPQPAARIISRLSF